MPGPEDSTSPEERLADARRRLYMPGASESDLEVVVALEAETADRPDEAPPPAEADQEQPPPDAPRRPARSRMTLLLGGTAVVLFVAATMLVVGQARTEQRREASVAAVVSISLRQLLTRFSSTLPSEWQGAPIVAARDRVRGTVSLPVSTDAMAEHHFLVIRCPGEDGRWSVRVHSTTLPGEHPMTGSCGDLGFAPLPLGTDTVRVRVEGRQAYAVVVMAHS